MRRLERFAGGGTPIGMVRLAARDEARVRELRSGLEVLDRRTPEALPSFVGALRELLGGARVMAHAIEPTYPGYHLRYFHGAGLAVANLQASEITGRLMSQTRSRFGLFDPIRPEANQRDRVIRLPPTSQMAEVLASKGSAAFLNRYRISPAAWEETVQMTVGPVQAMYRELGLVSSEQLRILVCNGPRLLAFVGAYRDDFTAYELALFRALAPALKRRLLFEERVLGSGWRDDAFETLLEQYPAPAFILDRAAGIELANSAGEALLGSDRAALVSAFPAALRARTVPLQLKIGPAELRVTPFVDTGATQVFLGVVGMQRDPTGRARQAQARWQLTPRQTEVLVLLANGRSNREIAAGLGCTPRTVEIHVSALLAKLDVESRSQAVARFWSELDG